MLFLLEGRITALVDGTSYDVEPGALVVAPAGTPCTFHVVGESARFVAITSGDGAGRFFADVAGSVPVGQLLVPYLVVRIWMLVVCVLLIRRGGQGAGSLALGRTRLDSSRMAWSSLGSNILILRSRKESLWRPTNRP